LWLSFTNNAAAAFIPGAFRAELRVKTRANSQPQKISKFRIKKACIAVKRRRNIAIHGSHNFHAMKRLTLLFACVATSVVTVSAQTKIFSERDLDPWIPKVSLFVARTPSVPDAITAARTWDGGGANDNWDTINNWDGNVTIPAATDDVTFGTGFASGTSISLNGNRTVNSLSITSTTAFSLDDNILTITSGDITRSAASGTTTINSGIALGGAAAWNISGNLVANGIVSGGVLLTKTGSGTLTLSGNNMFSGGLTLSAGTLVFGHDNAAGSGTLTLTAGTTVQGTGGARTIANNLSITGNITFSGSENLTFTDSFDQGAGRTYTVNNTTEFSGAITGGDNLTKSGTGTLILSGNNTIGAVTVNTGGALRVANDGALGTTAADTTVNSGGALELIGGRTIGAEALTLKGAGISSGGALRNVSGDNSWAGTITIPDGGARINSDAGTLTISGGITESGGAVKTLTFGGAGNTTVTGIISETGLDLALAKDGAGILTLTNANTYSQGTTISAGTLLVNNTSDSGTGTGMVTVSNSGTVLGGTGTISGLVLINGPANITGGTNGTVGTLTLGSTTFTGSGGNLATYLVDLSGATSDRLTITGALSLSGTSDKISFSGAADGTTTYVLASYSSIIGTFDTVTGLPSGYQLIYGTNELDLAPIPEPATWISGALMIGLLGWSQLRKHSRPGGKRFARLVRRAA
jgi:autotransporter-associated beta strand protein